MNELLLYLCINSLKMRIGKNILSFLYFFHKNVFFWKNSLVKDLIFAWCLVLTYIYILEIVKLITCAILDKMRILSQNTKKSTNSVNVV